MDSNDERERKRALENVSRKINEPSLYTAWDAVEMDFHADTEKNKPFTQSKIENFYHNGFYPDSVLLVVLATASLICSNAASIGALVNFWGRRDIAAASRHNRKKLAIPFINNRKQIENILNRLVMYGLVVKYVFRPLRSCQDVIIPYEELYIATGAGIRLAKQTWIDLRDEVMGDPIRNCLQVDDAFSRALRAQVMAPFFSSEKVKNVMFSRVFTLEKGRFTAEGFIRFNKDGMKGSYENDYDVLFEGITFHTNENTRTAQGKAQVIKDRLIALSNFVKEHGSNDRPTYIVFGCEDGMGIQKLLDIIFEECPELLSRVLFTTGNVIEKSFALEAPENLRDCFIVMEQGSDMKYAANGAFGYDFIKSKGFGFGTTV